MNRIPNQSFVDKIANGLRMANASSVAADVRKSDEEASKPVLMINSDATFKESDISKAAFGFKHIPVNEILKEEGGVSMSTLKKYFDVQFKGE